MLLVLATGACDRAPDSLLRVATSIRPGYELLYVARGEGWYDERRIRLVEMISATDVLLALRNGAVEAAAVTLDEALQVQSRGVDLAGILVFDYSNGADAVVARGGLSRVEELKGRRVGIEGAAAGAVLLESALSSAGLTAGDIDIVYVTADQQEDALLSGRVDAVATLDPVRSRLLAHDARVLYDSTHIPRRIVDLLVVRRDALVMHGECLKMLVSGYFRALGQWRSRMEPTAAMMVPRLRLSVPGTLDAFRRIEIPGLAVNRMLLGGPTPALDTTARKLAEFMVDHRLLSSRPRSERFADAGTLPAPNP